MRHVFLFSQAWSWSPKGQTICEMGVFFRDPASLRDPGTGQGSTQLPFAPLLVLKGIDFTTRHICCVLFFQGSSPDGSQGPFHSFGACLDVKKINSWPKNGFSVLKHSKFSTFSRGAGSDRAAPPPSPSERQEELNGAQLMADGAQQPGTRLGFLFSPRDLWPRCFLFWVCVCFCLFLVFFPSGLRSCEKEKKQNMG